VRQRDDFLHPQLTGLGKNLCQTLTVATCLSGFSFSHFSSLQAQTNQADSGKDLTTAKTTLFL
jgi:hypothetical protein